MLFRRDLGFDAVFGQVHCVIIGICILIGLAGCTVAFIENGIPHLRGQHKITIGFGSAGALDI